MGYLIRPYVISIVDIDDISVGESIGFTYSHIMHASI